MTTFPVVAVLLTALAGAAAPSPQQAQELKMIAQEAGQGDVGAELLYGLAWLDGRYHLKADPAKAAHWLRRAARGGHAYAQMTLGKLYAEGRGVKKNPATAVYWWRQAARAGTPEAEYLLGKARLEGNGTQKNPARAVHWLTRAAHAGNDDARFLLGRMYYEGYAVAQDKELGVDWLSRAADHGHTGALNFLRGISGAVGATTMIHQQHADELKARANKGDPHAQYELGLRYESGAYDVLRNDAEALHWLTEAANNGNRKAMRALAHIYAAGELGQMPDPAKAAEWKARATTR